MQEFKVGDHVIVDEGSSIWHGLTTGVDGIVVTPEPGYPYPRVRSLARSRYDYDTQYVDPAALIKVDDLVTYPERIYKTGDRVLVTGNTSKCTHYLTVGTDAEVIGDEGFDNWRPELYRVRGLGTYGRTDVQWVHPCDLEAGPTYPRRSWWVDYAPPADDFEIIDFTLTPAATIALNETRRAAALTKAVEVLGAHRDIDELTAVADWLLDS